MNLYHSLKYIKKHLNADFPDKLTQDLNTQENKTNNPLIYNRLSSIFKKTTQSGLNKKDFQTLYDTANKWLQNGSITDLETAKALKPFFPCLDAQKKSVLDFRVKDKNGESNDYTKNFDMLVHAASITETLKFWKDENLLESSQFAEIVKKNIERLDKDFSFPPPAKNTPLPSSAANDPKHD